MPNRIQRENATGDLDMVESFDLGAIGLVLLLIFIVGTIYMTNVILEFQDGAKGRWCDIVVKYNSTDPACEGTPLKVN